MSTPAAPGAGTTAALRQIALQLQAMMHQQQIYNNVPAQSQAAIQARQAMVNPGGGGGMNGAPPPGTGTVSGMPGVAWMQQAAQALIGQVVLNQPRQGLPAVGPTPPATPQGGNPGGPGQLPSFAMMPGLMNHFGGSARGAVMPFNPAASPGQGIMPSGGGGGSGIGKWVRSSLPTLGGAIAGPWGAAAGAAVAEGTQIPAEVRSQRDKNSYYQGVEGGSNAAGFGERLHEEGYRWSTVGVLSSSEARQAFKGVTRLGYNSKVEGGPGRQDALNFIYHGKTSYGGSVGESLQELQTYSQSALTNFDKLSKALKDVSDSAGKAGINAQMARGEFTQLMDQAIKSGFGSAAPDVAQLEQQTKNSYGRAFEGVDVSGRLTQSHAVMASSLSGISVADYMTGGASVKGAADQKLDSATVSAILKPGVADWIQQQINQAGGNVGQDVAQQIAEQMLRQFYPDDLQAFGPVVASISGNSGLADDPVKAAMWIVQQFNGKGAEATAKTISQSTNADNQKLHAKNQVQSGTKLYQNHRDLMTSSGFGDQQTAATKAYDQWSQANGGDQDLVVRNLLKDVDDDKTKVAVTTASGKRVVSLADAIKNHQDELASGKAVVVEGNQAGKSVKDIVGAQNVDPLRDYSKEAGATDNSGQSYDDWAKSHSTKSDKLQISLTPDARRLLTVLDSTGVSGSAATATPPLSPYAANPSYSGE